MFRHKNKTKLLVVVVLILGLIVGPGAIFADEPESTVLANHVGDTPPGDGSEMEGVFPCERALPSNEPIRWWTDCAWKDVGAEGSPNYILVCPTCSSYGRTREAGFVGTAALWGLYQGRGYAGWYGGGDNLALAKFRLVGFPTGELEKVVLSFEGINLDNLGDTCGDVIFKVEILSYVLTYTWGERGYSFYSKQDVVLALVAEVTGHYLRAVTEEDGTTPVLGFRFSDEQVSGLEEAIDRSESNSRWSLFIRVSLAEPPTEGNCLLKFDQTLLTIIKE